LRSKPAHTTGRDNYCSADAKTAELLPFDEAFACCCSAAGKRTPGQKWFQRSSESRLVYVSEGGVFGGIPESCG